MVKQEQIELMDDIKRYIKCYRKALALENRIFARIEPLVKRWSRGKIRPKNGQIHADSDLQQSALKQLKIHLHQFEGETFQNLLKFTFSIVRNKRYEYGRRLQTGKRDTRRHVPLVAYDPVGREPDPAALVENQEDHERQLMECLKKIDDDKDRVLLLLRRALEVPSKAVGELYGMPANSVDQRIFRLTAKLRDSREDESQKPSLAAPKSGGKDALDPKNLRIGLRFGEFTILEKMGQGGFATVYLAKEEAPFCRDAALKVAHRDADPAIRKSREMRFDREKRITAKLHDLPVAQLYAQGSTHDLCWFAMELIESRRLDYRLIRANPAFHRILAGRVAELAMTVHRFHERGIVHRDLKLANVTYNPKNESIYVLDFGLASEHEKDDLPSFPSQNCKLTRHDERPGTAGYMAPETARGQCDRRGDIFGLGTILYELFAGQHPFIDNGKPSQIRADAAQVDPRPLRKKDVPAELERIVIKALAHRPGDRYETGLGLADDLRNFADHHEGRPTRLCGRPAYARMAAWTSIGTENAETARISHRRTVLAERLRLWLSGRSRRCHNNRLVRKACAAALHGSEEGPAAYWDAEILLIVVDAGCVARMQAAASIDPPSIASNIIDELLEQLQVFPSSLRAEEANWAIRSWCDALGLNVERGY